MAETTARVLRLLDLLQSRPVWSGTELGARLGVTTRSVRRDVERLRELGYPVNATQGAGGGYQLGAGRRLPPLLLDDDEAVAIAVCLRVAAGGTVEGVGEAAVRTLAKLDQVLPGRLRGQVEAIHAATVTLDHPGPVVDARALLLLARAVRGLERVTFTYTGVTGPPSLRRVEPYRLVATGRRWYLLAFDLDRDDWRTFRLDRLTDAAATGWRFAPREAPDAADYVRRAISQSAYDHVARVRIEAPEPVVAQRIPPSVGTVTADGPRRCLLEAGGSDLDAMAMHLGALPWELTVLDPPELREAMGRQADRLARAARMRP
ncbi:MAG TPA: YafY family protein [Intrasporangium sp.]|uniref:helix-turn-helix transcriptional regulator n=1 Tax=Intrasporangium sp. TaxID=1925024 RepID=UPI002D7739FD|nr:YafY family protein [Intrasporangium sp.]HET7399784.1 YafY family protein [Intrasporangium sp.]